MLETITAMLEFGAFGFWTVMAVYAIMIMIFLERWDEKDLPFGFMIFLTALLASIFYFFGPLKEGLTWIASHKLLSVGAFGCYFVIGSAYSMLKFWCLLDKLKDAYIDFKTAWLINYLGSEEVDAMKGELRIPDILQEKWVYALRVEGAIANFSSGTLKVSDYKTTITTWIIWWPISGIWFIINDPIKRLANWLYAQFKGVYAWIYKKSLGKIQEDLSWDKAREKVEKLEKIKNVSERNEA